MTEKTNKERTSITIDPKLLQRARAYCTEATEDRGGRKVSFSELVTKAIEAYIGPDMAFSPEDLDVQV